jgi:3-hydroxypropanoate dehydrogenase
MPDRLPDATLDQIFLKARTRRGWEPDAVPPALLREIYALARMGPTASNGNPGRFLFLVSEAAKQKLSPFMSGGNRARTLAAPVNVIMAYDLNFAQHYPLLNPRAVRAGGAPEDPAETLETAFRSGTLQAAYLMLAARSLGLDCGPMSGFDQDGVNAAFFAGTSWRANFICNIGHGNDEHLHPRAPRLEFEQACAIL